MGATRQAVTMAAVALTAAALAACGGDSHRSSAATTPAPAAAGPVPPAAATPAPLPRHSAALARELTATHAELYRAIDAWLAAGDPGAGRAPAAVSAHALRQQAIYRRLAARPRLAANTLARLDGAVAAEARDVLAAMRALRVLNAPFAAQRRKQGLKIRLAEPEPAGRLLSYYREARRRSGIGPALLAAVNLVESSFGRLVNRSVAGAQGPMQFMPATWATYGRGGDVHDARDAILGAARLLRAGGAPGDERGALYRYNPSPLYVTAVSRYARLIRREPRAFYAMYAWRAPVPHTVGG